jgi:2-keto-4-pentenoate hydratase
VAAVDRRLVRALREQLDQRDALVRQGAERIGWKLGLSERDSIGGEIGVGHLTSATLLASGGSYVAADGEAELRADAEIVVEVSRDVDPADDPAAVREAIAGYGAALEICDVAPLANEPYSVVAANDFHRAVAFAELHAALPSHAEGELLVNGAVRASGPAPRDIPERLSAASRILAAVGERLRAGDRIITSLIVQVPIASGDDVVARVGALGAARLRISAPRQSHS